MKKLLVVTAVVVVTMGVALAAYSGARGHGGRGGGMIGRLIDDKDVQDRLGLKNDQVARLREIRNEARTSTRRLRAQAIKTRADLRAAMLDTKASRQDLERRATAVRDAVRDLSQEVTKRLLDARDVLSVDQREELRSIIRERIGSARQGVMRGRRHHAQRDSAPSAGADDGTADDDAPVSPEPE